MITTSAIKADRIEVKEGSRLKLALLVIATAQLMLVLDDAIANIALPSIQQDLGVSVFTLPWIVNAYILAFGGLLLFGGRVGDLYGRKKVFKIGLIVFTLASLLGGFAPNGELLITSRGLQGIGAALTAPNALALIATNFPVGALFLTYFGLGMGFIPTSLTAGYQVREGQTGVVSALLNTSQQLGAALGLAVLTTVYTSVANRVLPNASNVFQSGVTQHDNDVIIKASEVLSEGYTTAFLTGAIMLLIAAIVVAIMVNTKHTQRIAKTGAVT